MALQLIATPLGNPGDITLRAIEALKSADVVIGEERKEVSKLLKAVGIESKRLELLNEHSKDEDISELLEFCRDSRVALVTDCGTPGFCDPGAKLVASCRKAGIPVSPLPGASSLMCLLSVSGTDMRQFHFRGFLPAEREERGRSIRELERAPHPVILMDTPYRLERLLSELASAWPERQVLLGIDFTQSTEEIFEGRLRDVAEKVGKRKAEFILALFPHAKSVSQKKSLSPVGVSRPSGNAPKRRPKLRKSALTKRR